MVRQIAAVLAAALLVVAGVSVGVADTAAASDGGTDRPGTGGGPVTVPDGDPAPIATPPSGPPEPDDGNGSQAKRAADGRTTDRSGRQLTTQTAASERRAPPSSDVVGYEGGYWYDDPLRVDLTPGNGFNDTEFAALKNRTKARVEYIRNREFHHEITFEFITREELLDKGFFTFEEYPPRDQLWEAMLVVGENRTVAEELEVLYEDVVDGYSTGGTVAFVVEDTESPRIDPATLAHELDHEIDPDTPVERELTTWDDRAAARSVAEGVASFAEHQYLELCDREWSCVDRPENASVVEGFDANMGLFLWFASSYTLGANLMDEVYERSADRAIDRRFPITQPDPSLGTGLIGTLSREAGNQALDARFGDPPYSMEQFIHPERYPGDRPEEVSVTDRSTGEWDPTTDESDEVGEAILYAALKSNGVIGGPDPEITEDQRTGLNYSHPATIGWEGDAVRTYTNGSHEGYVFVSEWENASEAGEFRAAWLDLLRSKGGERLVEDVYRIDSGPFADAFRVRQDGNRVIVVNAPTAAALDEVHDPDE